MSDESRVGAGDGCGTDVAAYALGALSPAEAEAFERHLQECTICAEELSTFGPVVDALAMSPPQYRTPPALRRRVIAEVRPKPDRSRARRTAFATATAAAVALAAVVFAIVTLVSSGSGGVRVLQASVIGSPGTAQVRLANGRAELIVRHFPAPSPGHLYEVWLQRPSGQPVPARVLFDVSAQGARDVGVPETLHGVKALLVTEEPASGSLVPTRPPVIVGPLS
jgi:Anti-sigma-K factor rskA/Putative zinc-finger